MCNQRKSKFKIIVLLIIFISLFPSKILADEPFKYTINGEEYRYTKDYDDGTSGPNVEDVKWKLKGYTTDSDALGGVDVNSFEKNDEYGWYEYEEGGTKWVVLGAANHNTLSTYKGIESAQWYYRAKFEHIHYFNKKDTVQFVYKGESFDGMILGSGTNTAYFPQLFNNTYDPKLNLLNVYLGKEKTDEVQEKINELENSGNDIEVSIDGSYSEDADITESENKNFFVSLFARIMSVLGDVLHALIDSARTLKSFLYSRHASYSKDEIMANEELQSEIQVADEGSEGTGTYATVDIPTTVINRDGQTEKAFAEDTEIPVIPMDLYSISINKIDMLDVNFYDNSEDSNDSSFWQFICGVVRACSNATMYISAALFLTILIWKSIIVVKASLDGNPGEMAETKEVLNSWLKGIVLIVVIYSIAALMIYLYEWALDLVIGDNDSNYLIRANVSGMYSFNTNIIGIVKYRSLTTNILAAFGFSLLYFIMELFNFAWFLAMFARMLFIGILTIIAPFTAVSMARGSNVEELSGVENIFNFKGWLSAYLIAMWIPMAIILLYRLVIFII